MIIATVVFGDPIFSRMADVLEYSVRRNQPDATFMRIAAPPHTHIKSIPTHCPANQQKQLLWADVVCKNAGKNIVLIDCDTVLLNDISHVFDNSFDLAYTVRPYRAPINCGVVFVRANAATMGFFDKWNSWIAWLLSDGERSHLQSRLRRYAGIAQAGFSHALDAVNFPLETLTLPCERYNSVDQTWKDFNEDTCVLHIKGRLRRCVVIENADPVKHPIISEPMRVWQKYAEDAQQSMETI